MQTQTEQIGPIVENLVQNTFVNRCKSCNVRYRRTDADYCEYCFGRLKRKEKLTPERIEKTVLELVEPRYANAVMTDIEPTIRDQLRGRKTWQDVYLWGLPGRGKTYLMAALIRAYTGDGYECKRISFDEFCCQIRSTISPATKVTEFEMTELYKAVDMLFIDDLGLRSQKESDFVYQTFFLTLNKRQERLLPTFISSNKNPETLSKTLFDARILSRLSDAMVIEMGGNDKRKTVSK